MIPATPLLIDAGPSEIGWSFWSPFFSCLQKGYRTYINKERDRSKKVKKRRGPPRPGPGTADERRDLEAVGKDKRDMLPPSPALTMGSMGHVALAHKYAQHACEHGGLVYEGELITDPDVFYNPLDAVETWVMVNERGGKYVEDITKTYMKYRAKDAGFSQQVVGVEIAVRLTLGLNGLREWGMWLDRPWHQEGVTSRHALLTEHTPLIAPGLERGRKGAHGLYHGGPISITKRFDMVVRDQSGRYYIWDHKFTGGRITNEKTRQYCMDGQFAVNHIAGDLLFGRQFGGVLLNFVQRRPPYINARQMVPRTAPRDRAFPSMLKAKAQEVGLLLARSAPTEDWSMAQSELICWHKYGKCQAWKYCTGG